MPAPEQSPLGKATAYTDHYDPTLLFPIPRADKRREIGRRSREFAVKWHSAEAGGQHFDGIYRRLLQGDPLLRVTANPGADHA